MGRSGRRTSGTHLVHLTLAELLPDDLAALDDAEEERAQDDRAQLRLLVVGRGGRRGRKARDGGERVGPEVFARPESRCERVTGVECRLRAKGRVSPCPDAQELEDKRGGLTSSRSTSSWSQTTSWADSGSAGSKGGRDGCRCRSFCEWRNVSVRASLIWWVVASVSVACLLSDRAGERWEDAPRWRS